MDKSTHKAEVIKIREIEPHPDADKLGLIKVWGYSVVIRLDDWEEGDLAAYIVPDTLVPNKDPFSFLFTMNRSRYDIDDDDYAVKNKKEGAYSRVTVIRLRGILSHGLLVPAPEGMEIGDDAGEFFEIQRYEPLPSFKTTGEIEAPPPGIHMPTYDVDSLLRYIKVFQPGERVSVSEKIHGTNGRWVLHPDKEAELRMWAGSRNQWKAPIGENSPWWAALKNCPEVEEFCRANPGVAVYGEVYGPIQKNFNYGSNIPRIAVFDILQKGKWMNVNEAREFALELPWVPLITADMPFNIEALTEMAEGETLLAASHIREGIVVRPLEERYDREVGRVQLKMVSEAYLGGGKRKKK